MTFKFRAGAPGALMLVAAGPAQFDKLKPAAPAPDGSVWVKTLLW
jgi:hypothetical protein